jgi:hypothetical protein
MILLWRRIVCSPVRGMETNDTMEPWQQSLTSVICIYTLLTRAFISMNFTMKSSLVQESHAAVFISGYLYIFHYPDIRKAYSYRVTSVSEMAMDISKNVSRTFLQSIYTAQKSDFTVSFLLHEPSGDPPHQRHERNSNHRKYPTTDLQLYARAGKR